MSIRGIQQIVVHLETFRNIELWYQGLYFLKIQIYRTDGNNKMTYAHPFAYTQNYHPFEQSQKYYDSQIIKPALINDETSSFISKMFIVKYFEEEVELNDICHFRIESDLTENEFQINVQVCLMFFDCITKKYDKPQDLALTDSKQVKIKNYHMLVGRKGVHQFCPLLFDEQYFSLINMCVHSICLDYRFRSSAMQLSQFSKLTYQQKVKLIEKNKNNEIKQISFYKSVLRDLGVNDNKQSLNIIESVLLGQIKKNYYQLLHNYSNMFAKVIGEHQKNIFHEQIVYPNNLALFEDQERVSKKDDRLFIKYKTTNSQQITEKIIIEVNQVSTQLTKLWNIYLDLFKINPRFTVAVLEEQYLYRERQFWKKLTLTNQIKTNDLSIGYFPNQQNQQNYLLEQKNKIGHPSQIMPDSFIQKRDNLPVIIQNIYYLQQEDKPKLKERMSILKEDIDYHQQGIHLIVFVHGFQGNSFDMRLIKNYISFLYPQSMFLCSSSNQEMTDSDIFEMGQRLATQVKSYIIQNFPSNTLGRLSFIGHSLGGLKIRAALPKLLQYRNKFEVYISFSSPHLGYGINTSSVIEAGMWVLQKMKNSICLRQLSMSDNSNLEETCLYKLSQAEGLQHFKRIFLFSSKQDSYAPYESARIEIQPSFLSQKNKSTHIKMAKNILQNVKSGVLRRLKVIFKIGHKNLDTLIGRAAHIMFLESHELIKILLFTQPNIFS